MRRSHSATVSAIATAMALTVLAAGCGSSASTSTAPTSFTRCSVTANGGNTLPAAGGTGTVTVSAALGVGWAELVALPEYFCLMGRRDADKLDIAEELDRFDSHIGSFRQSVNESGADPVGKRLGFLLQEMVREANTTGSKANDAAILADVVMIKEELERIREQVENIE